jgi:hypothetical protein
MHNMNPTIDTHTQQQQQHDDINEIKKIIQQHIKDTNQQEHQQQQHDDQHDIFHTTNQYQQ